MDTTFVAIDFETATKHYNSACSIGVVLFNSDKILEEKYYLIQPPNNEYNRDNINIHKITPNDTKDSPTFDIVWEEIKHYFNGDHVLIAQNAQFDMSVLKSSLTHYNLDYNEFTYWDSIKIATYIVPNDVKKGLASLTSYFEISLDQHHNALCDARACAEICMICFKEMAKDSYYVKKDGNFKKYFLKKLNTSFLALVAKQKLSFKGSRKKQKKFDRFSNTRANANKFTQNLNADKNNPFYNKNIVVTGDIPGFSREKLFGIISNNGGIVKNGVTKQTDILVVGKQDLKLLGESGISSKEKKATEYINSGSKIKILKESELISILKSIK